MKKMLTITIVLLTSVLLTGCGGGGATVQASSTTSGQELIDLKKAQDAGIITQKEYDEMKEKILDKN